ncbi:MAG: hypothetical protein ABR598_03735 [Candidatus Dormibacteria bacterium]
MAENPKTDGAEKSLRQVAPGGDAVAVIFLAIALLTAASLVMNRPAEIRALIVSGVFMLVFLVPAYILYASARDSGIFVTDERVEFRVLGQVRAGWPRSEVQTLEPSSRGVRIVGAGGRTLRDIRYRWWNTIQVEKLARSTGLAPVSPPLATADGATSPVSGPTRSEVDPGKPGDGG